MYNKKLLRTSHRYLSILLSIFFILTVLISCGGGNGGGVENTAPIAADAGFSVLPGNTVTGTLPASDVDGDSLTYNNVTDPTNGTLTITDLNTGAFTYTLNSSASGDTFTFLANDGQLDSNIATVTIIGTIPAAPSSGLQATNGDQRVTLNWDAVSGADSYNVYWSDTPAMGTSGNKITGVTPPFYHDDLTNGLNYYYVITAVNVVGESTASTEISATPIDIEISSLTFVDQKLADCVATEAVGLTYVHQLNNLQCKHKGITDLTGIEALTNLTTLNLFNNTIIDITALSGLTKLTILYLTTNNISDVSALSGLANLTELGLSQNTINDITTLSGLTNLTDLYLYDTGISDISALSNLINLTTLDLGYNYVINDVSALSGLVNLERLYLSRNNISDISALSNLTKLTNLHLEINNISDVSALSGMTNLTTLPLFQNDISDITPLSGLIHLTYLYLSSNNISDVSPLSGMTKMNYLNLAYNNIGGQGVGRVDTLISMTNTTEILLTGNIGMSCNELTTLINALGSPPVDSDNQPTAPDVILPGSNCTNP